MSSDSDSGDKRHPKKQFLVLISVLVVNIVSVKDQHHEAHKNDINCECATQRSEAVKAKQIASSDSGTGPWARVVEFFDNDIAV